MPWSRILEGWSMAAWVQTCREFEEHPAALAYTSKSPPGPGWRASPSVFHERFNLLGLLFNFQQFFRLASTGGGGGVPAGSLAGRLLRWVCGGAGTACCA